MQGSEEEQQMELNTAIQYNHPGWVANYNSISLKNSSPLYVPKAAYYLVPIFIIVT